MYEDVIDMVKVYERSFRYVDKGTLPYLFNITIKKTTDKNIDNKDPTEDTVKLK